MKTPREILLSRHAHANRSLDAMRTRVLKQLDSATSTTLDESESPAVLQQLWDLRWHLLPIAALWMLAIGLQLSSGSGTSATRAHVSESKRDQMLASVRENRRQLSELIEARSGESSPKSEKNLRPRTQSGTGKNIPRTC